MNKRLYKVLLFIVSLISSLVLCGCGQTAGSDADSVSVKAASVEWLEGTDEMQQHAPNCEINTEVGEDPVGGRWRYVDYNELACMYIYHDRYIQLREQFDDYADSAYSFYWNDPYYYEPFLSARESE